MIISIIFGGANLQYAQTSIPNWDGTQSDWAEEELMEAYSLDLTYPLVLNNFRKNLTREEFCTLVIKLYEQLTNEEAQLGANPFTDTANEEIIKAYNLGIVKGVSSISFAPNNQITRQEICVMIHRALKVSLTGIEESYAGDFPFTDKSYIASWAIDSVKFAYGHGIMKGTGNNIIAPLDNTTREQGIILIKRTFESFGSNTNILDPNKLLVDDKSGLISTNMKLPIMVNPLGNYRQMEEGNLFFPKFDEKIQLFVASGDTKPSIKPSVDYIYNITKKTGLTKNVYTDSTMTAFIDKDGISKRWFYFSLLDSINTSKVIWQVSSLPFNGFEKDWRYPSGLLASGELTKTTNEFQIDFSTIKFASLENMLALNLDIIDIKPINTDLLVWANNFKPISSSRDVYYVRAVPVNNMGNPVGDPGEGIAVIYGEKVAESKVNEKITSDFQIWVPTNSGSIGSGEYPNYPIYRPVFRVEPGLQNQWLFHFKDIDQNTKKMVLQFSTQEYPSVGGGWPDTPNIIYERSYTLPINIIHSSYPNSVLVDLSKFLKPSNQMKEGDLIRYYVRGIIFTDSNTPGEYALHYSSPVTMEYGFGKPITYYSDNPYKNVETLSYSLPSISIKNYSKVKWPTNDYMEHYYVFRAPKWDEIKSKFKNTNTGEILYPYGTNKAYYDSIGIDSTQEYEEKVIPRVLPPNTKVYIPKPVEADKSWYQQLFEGVVNFFNDLANVVKDIVNQVSSAYERLKNDLIMFVVNLCPVDSLKGYFKSALEAWVNYGLVWLGIPPTLPNFNQLADMSMDYYVKVVLTEAGIPENEWTEQVLEDLTVEMGRQINQAANYADMNPISAPFLKLDPDYMYKPAYLDIELKNTTTKRSIPGMLELNVTFEMDYSNMKNPIYPLSLSSYSNYSYSSDAGWSDSTKYREHFEQGLNGYSINYSQGYKSVYDVFVPMKKVKLPFLKAGDSTTVRVYLEPFRQGSFTRYPGAQSVTSVDFENMYFSNGNKLFTFFNIRGIFPTAEKYLMENSNMLYLDPDTDYVFLNESNAKISERVQKPVSVDWIK